MTTSSSVDFTQNRTSIINDAYSQLGILAEGETLTNEQYQRASRKLNRMIKSWQTDGIHLWKYRIATLFLEKGKENYLLGGSGDNATESFVRTTSSADAVLGAGSITATSVTGMTSGDYIGIVLDSGAIQWTTINGAPAGLVITLTDVLEEAVSSGNIIYTYTTKITRPISIENVNIKINNSSETPMFLLSRQEYFDLSSKSNQGTPTQYYYNPLLVNGKLYIWTTASTPNDYINFSYIPDFEDFDTALNTGDFPVEWLDCVIYNLAVRIGVDEGLAGTNSFIEIKNMAYELKAQAEGFDREQGFISFTPFGDNI